MTQEQIDAVDVHGRTALHYAVHQGHEKICGVLLEAGARLDAKTSDGLTLLEVAQRFHPTNEALLDLFSGHGHAQLPGTVCDHCGKTAAQASVSSLKTCSQCHGVRYCDAACQSAAWRGHKAACKARKAELEEATRPRQT